MNKRTKIVAGTLMTIGVALAGTTLAEGTAQALPGGTMPLSSWPGCPPDSPEGPCRWCPGGSAGTDREPSDQSSGLG